MAFFWKHDDEDRERDEERLRHSIYRLERAVEALTLALKSPQQVQKFTVTQKGALVANSISGIAVGGKGAFAALPVPAGSVVVGGAVPAWASSDPLAVVSAAADGLSCSVAVDATAPVGGSFTLSVSATNSDGSIATGSASVPYLAPPPPPPVPVKSFDINQTA